MQNPTLTTAEVSFSGINCFFHTPYGRLFFSSLNQTSFQRKNISTVKNNHQAVNFICSILACGTLIKLFTSNPVYSWGHWTGGAGPEVLRSFREYTSLTHSPRNPSLWISLLNFAWICRSLKTPA